MLTCFIYWQHTAEPSSNGRWGGRNKKNLLGCMKSSWECSHFQIRLWKCYRCLQHWETDSTQATGARLQSQCTAIGLHLNLKDFNWEDNPMNASRKRWRKIQFYSIYTFLYVTQGKKRSGLKSINHHNYEISKAFVFSTPLWSKLNVLQKYSTEKKWCAWIFIRKISGIYAFYCFFFLKMHDLPENNYFLRN